MAALSALPVFKVSSDESRPFAPRYLPRRMPLVTKHLNTTVILSFCHAIILPRYLILPLVSAGGRSCDPTRLTPGFFLPLLSVWRGPARASPEGQDLGKSTFVVVVVVILVVVWR